jgi:CBS domain-containing protein
MKTVRQLLESKGNSILAVSPDATVYEALSIMADQHVGALLVMQDAKLVGIFSERDYAREIDLKDKTARKALVREAMTPESCLITVGLSDTIDNCMNLVTDKRIRHLPVIEAGRVVGVLSIGDLVKETIAHQRFLIDQLEGYIKG